MNFANTTFTLRSRVEVPRMTVAHEKQRRKQECMMISNDVILIISNQTTVRINIAKGTAVNEIKNKMIVNIFFKFNPALFISRFVIPFTCNFYQFVMLRTKCR